MLIDNHIHAVSILVLVCTINCTYFYRALYIKHLYSAVDSFLNPGVFVVIAKLR
jgi:hypothetical protein